MSAIDERPAAEATGKSTRDSDQLPVGEATWALTLPQLPYADALHAALDEAGLQPGVLEAGLREDGGRPELFLRLCWPPLHHGLADAVQDTGVTLAWSHVTGWTAHDADGRSALLDVDELADVALVVDAARHFTRRGLADEWLPPGTARWTEAVYLDVALGLFDERTSR
ncbi:hypothetical protein AB0R01_14690 [Streptomyces rochei]|uniref:hypothetical protein n=1 Tax=Streptomyces rochei TaxID=1928 RepID=UPI00343934F5